MAITNVVASLHAKLRALQCNQGGWGFQANQQAVEPTCLSILALRNDRSPDVESALRTVESLQNSDGSWPAFMGDEPEGCWTTSIAVLTLMATRQQSHHIRQGVRWLLDAKGREANWFWRWKFKTVDTRVQFDPAKYGWSWVPGATSWVIPTAFSLIALRQARNRSLDPTAEDMERIEIGVSMLLDRMCPGGGWNAGNSIAFGVPYTPYIDATAIALLALDGHETSAVQASLAWLVKWLPGCPSRYSLSWGILALAEYRGVSPEVNETLERGVKLLISLIETAPAVDDVCTVAVCALALDAVKGDKVFEVRM
jgi:hypothetical protein